MGESGKFWAWVVGCFTLDVMMIAICITYYNLQDNQTIIKLAELGYSPAIIKCMHVSWEFDGAHDICKRVLTDAKLTAADARTLVEQLD